MSTVIEMPEVLQVAVSQSVSQTVAPVSPVATIDELFADSAPPIPEPQPEPAREERESNQDSEQDEEVPVPDQQPVEQPAAQPSANGLASVSASPAVESRIVEEIFEQNKYIRWCEGQIEHCKGELKSAKENFDEAVSRLRMLCDKLTKPLEEEAEGAAASAKNSTPAATAQDDEPIYGETFGEENVSQGDGQQKTAVSARPVQIRIIKDVLEDVDNPESKVLAKVGEVYSVIKVESESLIDGGVVQEDEVYVQIGSESICLEPGEFEVIQWDDEIQASTEPPADAEPVSDLIDFFGISESQAAKFAKAGINSVAQLKEKLASGFDLTTVPGVGKAKAEKFANMLADHG